VLRLWLGVVPGLPAPGLRTIAGHCGLDRKTVRRYVDAAEAAGLRRDSGVEAIDDELIGAVAEAVRPVRPNGHGAAWDQLLGFEKQITDWVAGDDCRDAEKTDRNRRATLARSRRASRVCQSWL